MIPSRKKNEIFIRSSNKKQQQQLNKPELIVTSYDTFVDHYWKKNEMKRKKNIYFERKNIESVINTAK
jgi:DNA polymerase IIIc chi subunit